MAVSIDYILTKYEINSSACINEQENIYFMDFWVVTVILSSGYDTIIRMWGVRHTHTGYSFHSHGSLSGPITE